MFLLDCLEVYWLSRPAKSWVYFFWGIRLLFGMCLVIAPPEAVPVVGRSSDPSVPRSPGASPQKCRAAHGPRHPAVRNPPRLSRFACGVLGWRVVFFLGAACTCNACVRVI